MITQQPPDELFLLQQIARQDRTALSLLYDRYARVIYTLAYRILNSVEEAEEIVLDVFVQVWKTAASYDSTKGRVDAWLFLLTRSRALDRLRRLSRNAKAKFASEDITFQLQANNSPEEDLLILERREQIASALQQLPDEQRIVLEMAYYEGLTHAQIAVKTGKSLGTIKTRIRLGLSKLRDALTSSEYR